jgi:hypothetical protein
VKFVEYDTERAVLHLRWKLCQDCESSGELVVESGSGSGSGNEERSGSGESSELNENGLNNGKQTKYLE